MPQMSDVPEFHLKLVLLIHFLLISITTIGDWVPSSYLFYNSLLVLFLIWSISQKHEDPLHMAIAADFISIFLDIFTLTFSWPYTNRGGETFCAGIGIIHLLFRPLALLILIKVLNERNGSSSGLNNLFGTTSARSPGSYEDIDRTGPTPTQQTPQSGGYDFSTAQQI